MVWPFLAPDVTPVLRANNLMLRGARYTDYPAWQSLRRSSREFLKPFEPRWSEADLTRRIYAARLRRSHQEAALGTDYSFMIFLTGSRADAENPGAAELLVGGVTLSNIRRRAAQYASLGYWMGEPFAGRGLMTEAVGIVVPFAFNTLHLHRIHAAFLPDNIASRRVLEKNGFREEGYAENYLQIDGRWCDHVLFGLTRERHLSFANHR